MTSWPSPDTVQKFNSMFGHGNLQLERSHRALSTDIEYDPFYRRILNKLPGPYYGLAVTQIFTTQKVVHFQVVHSCLPLGNKLNFTKLGNWLVHVYFQESV